MNILSKKKSSVARFVKVILDIDVPEVKCPICGHDNFDLKHIENDFSGMNWKGGKIIIYCNVCKTKITLERHYSLDRHKWENDYEL